MPVTTDGVTDLGRKIPTTLSDTDYFRKTENVLDKFQRALAKRNKVQLTVRYDADVVEWFQSKGKGYQRMMNAALRAFMEVEQENERYRQ